MEPTSAGRGYLEVDRLQHLYNHKEVLNIPRLRFERGKAYALVGPNGAGKTTLMLILSLLLKPTSGRVFFRGIEVTDENRREMRNGISMLLQNPLLFRTTVGKNVEYGLKVRYLGGSERRKRAKECLEMVGLDDLAERPVNELSGGEAQRVAIARALAIQPEILLLDELTANVDEANTKMVEEIVRSMSEESKATVIFSTHDRDQAHRLADEIITLMEGRITPFTPENIFKGKTLREGEDTWFDTGRIKIFLPTKEEVKAIYIDPKDIIISLTPFSSSARNCLEGVIEAIVADVDWVRLQIGAPEPFQVLITKRSLFEMGLNIGMKVYLTFKSSAVKVF